jgi:hypothetical protein
MAIALVITTLRLGDQVGGRDRVDGRVGLA